MKKLQKLKAIIIAAGIILSAAFYVLGGGAKAALGGSGESLIIGDDADSLDNSGSLGAAFGGTDNAGSGGNATAADSNGGSDNGGSGNGSGTTGGDVRSSEMMNTLSTSYADRLGEEIYLGTDGKGYISDELKEELRTYIRAAIREELVAICEEGYLEQAVSEAAAFAAEEAERKAGMVNINTADVSELMTLTGIGERRAQDIVSYRETHGAFNSPEDIMQVSGIKQSSYDKIKDKIYV